MLFRVALRLGILSLSLAAGTALAGPLDPLKVIVSKDQQSLVIYDGDTVVATSKVSTGKAGHATPTGIFSILEKRRHHRSNIYSNAPMPFMQRLTWSGIALHASNHVPAYPASHGCVRLPNDFAAELFKMTGRGMHVIVSDRQVVPEAISHPFLFQPGVVPEETPALLSDATLRPTMAQASGNVEVAMNEPAPAAKSEPEVRQPIRILITRRGEREIVTEVQATLNGLGFDAGIPDGSAGRQTREAVKAFQTAEKLEADGVIKPAFVEALFKKAGKPMPANGVLMVRQGFKPLFDAPVTIDTPTAALGTHFLQVQDIDPATGKGKWFAVTLDNVLSKPTMERLGIVEDVEAAALNNASTVLDRITLSDDVRKRIDALLADGSSLSINDTGIGQDTGDGTDFITVTRSKPS